MITFLQSVKATLWNGFLDLFLVKFAHRTPCFLDSFRSGVGGGLKKNLQSHLNTQLRLSEGTPFFVLLGTGDQSQGHSTTEGCPQPFLFLFF